MNNLQNGPVMDYRLESSGNNTSVLNQLYQIIQKQRVKFNHSLEANSEKKVHINPQVNLKYSKQGLKLYLNLFLKRRYIIL